MLHTLTIELDVDLWIPSFFHQLGEFLEFSVAADPAPHGKGCDECHLREWDGKIF